VALAGTVKVILEPVPVLNEDNPSLVRSTCQLRFVPDPVAVTVWPGVKLVPCAGEVIATEALGVTVRLKLVVFVTPPPAPVTVIVRVPVGVDVEVAMFRVREQVGLHDVEVVKVAVAPAGRPEVEKDTALEVPELKLAVMELLTDCPCITDRLPPLLRAKLNAGVEAIL
jgi:hypothetical protein